MTNANLKREIRERMARTGENYTRARTVILQQRQQARLAREQAQRKADGEERLVSLDDQAHPDQMRPGDVLHLESHGVFSEGELVRGPYLWRGEGVPPPGVDGGES